MAHKIILPDGWREVSGENETCAWVGIVRDTELEAQRHPDTNEDFPEDSPILE